MRKKTIFLIYFLILLLIIIIKVLEPYIGNEISSLLTTATTVIGIFSVFIEMKRSADISECEFIYNLQGQFDNNSKIQNIYEILDKDYSCNTKTKNIDRSDLVSYLTFLEMLSNLIVKKVININDIDYLFAYRFFIAVHNKKIQELELVKFKEYYMNIYTVYPMWYNYRKSKNRPIPYEENKLVIK